MVESVGDEDKAAVAQVAAEFLQEDLPEQQFGSPKAGSGMWASMIRVFDPIQVRGSWKMIFELNHDFLIDFNLNRLLHAT